MKNSIVQIIFCSLVITFCQVEFLSGQDTIYLRNPSFEDKPRIGGQYLIPILDWTDCGLTNFPDQSPPDIHPMKNNPFGVTNKAYDGKTYLGMVTRYSDTYESLSQYLSKPVEAEKCYSVTVYLALSEKYESPTMRSHLVEFDDGNRFGTRMTTENFSNPVELFIWGGDKSCRTHQLLAHSGPVSNHDWELFNLEFSPKETYQFITIGAYFQKGYSEPYNGHVLVDNFSPIVEIECK